MARIPFFGSRSAGGGRGFLSGSIGSAPIAVDFGRRSVRMLQLTKGALSYQCVAGAEIPGWVLGQMDGTDSANEVSSRLRETLSKCGFTSERCMMTLPAELFRADTARLPVMPDSELKQSVEFEASDRFGVEKSATVLGYQRLGEPTGGQQDVLIMAIPRSVVEAAVTPITGSGLAAVHLEHAALAALRAIWRQRVAEFTDPKEAADFVMLHLEDRVATLIIVKAGLPVMMRSVLGDWAPLNTAIQQRTRVGNKTQVGMASTDPKTSIGLQDTQIVSVEGTVNKTMDSSPESWRWCGLAEEALRCLRHLERNLNGWWPTRMVVTGPSGCDPHVVSSMESVCGLHGELAVPIRLLTSPAPCVQGNPWVATIGSAVAELPSLPAGCAAAMRPQHSSPPPPPPPPPAPSAEKAHAEGAAA